MAHFKEDTKIVAKMEENTEESRKPAGVRRHRSKKIGH